MYIIMFVPTVLIIEKAGGMRASLQIALGAAVVGNWIALFGDKIGVQIFG